MKDWKLLINKKIISLIIGDEIIREDMTFEYKMPYMTENDIIEFAKKVGKNEFSLPKASRWVYMSELLEYIVERNIVNIFFRELLNLRRFRTINLPNDGYHSPSMIYWETLHGFFNKVNQELFYDGCYIDYDVETWNFALVDDENEIVLNTEKISNIDKNYIKDLNNKIDKSIKDQDYESTITKSRTLIEEVIIYGIEKKDEKPSEKGNINSLYNQFKNLYNMHSDSNMDKRINMLLSGFEKIITSISQMRDKNSDAHGVGEKRINLEEHHVILYANSAITISNFFLAVIDNDKGGKVCQN